MRALEIIELDPAHINKWGYAYLLTPMGIAEKAAITARFLVRKQREHTQLQEEIAQLQEEVRQQQDLK